MKGNGISRIKKENVFKKILDLKKVKTKIKIIKNLRDLC